VSFATKRQLVAVYTAAPTRMAADLEGAGALGVELSKGDIRCFALSNGKASFPREPSGAGSAFMTPSEGLFDSLFLGRSLRLFKNAWGASMIAHIARTLRPGGQLIIWFDGSSRPQGFWQLADLEQFFGTATSKTANDHAVFVIDQPPNPPPSILNWYFSSFSELILHDMSIRYDLLQHDWSERSQPILNYNELNDPLLSGFFINPPVKEYVDVMRTWAGLSPALRMQGVSCETSAGSENEQRPRDFRTNLQNAINENSYLIGGISYKSALINAIIRDSFMESSGLRFADFGAGHGLLAAELLLDNDCPVDSALNVDINSVYLLKGATMYRGNLHALRRRLRFWQGAIESYPFDETFDVVTKIGSLLLVPAPQRKAVLDRTWSVLAPGGLLIIHETIKSPTFETMSYYDLMFNVEELDTLLSQFGKIERYLSTAVARVDQDKAGARTIFRVVKKPSR
jgi:SAM-dependent methyltransferase